jgi:hypothetical protein
MNPMRLLSLISAPPHLATTMLAHEAVKSRPISHLSNQAIIINPPLSQVRPWQGKLGDAQISAHPLRAEGEQITWRVEVSRGGQRVGAFDTVLSGQLSDTQFRPLASGKDAPLKTQILDMLRVPQKRLHNLGVTIENRNAPGGERLQATVVAMQQFRHGQWQTQGYAVGEVRSYSPSPLYEGQQREGLGYFRRSVSRGEPIHRADGKPATSLEEAKQIVQARLSNRSLTAVTAAGARQAQKTRRQQQQAVTSWGGSGTAQIVPWQAPVALDKPLQTMNAAERITYTVRVAKQYLPADVAARLQALMTPQTIVALAAYAGSHALGFGFIGDGLGLAHMLAGTREGLRQFDTYLRTTMQAKHPMELVNAGRQLSELAAPLMVDGGTMLATFGVGRVAAARRIDGRLVIATLVRRSRSLSKTIDPYETLREVGVPRSLTHNQVEIANACGLSSKLCKNESNRQATVIERGSKKYESNQSKPPQKFINRTGDPLPEVDRVGLFNARPLPTQYELILASALQKAGLTVHPQFAIPDSDNGNHFPWRYDLYVERELGDGMRGVLIEVDGRHHDRKFQQVQDARKEYLAELLGFGRVIRFRNEEVLYPKTAVAKVMSVLNSRRYSTYTK